ncbi:MAG: hypothetical protein AB2L11_09000 [Syntrophobacteraceae bacterium]
MKKRAVLIALFRVVLLILNPVIVTEPVDDLVGKGAKLIIADSDDMKDEVRQPVGLHPNTYLLHVSGDDILIGKAPQNMANVMGRMEYGQVMAGFAQHMKEGLCRSTLKHVCENRTHLKSRIE